MRKLKLYIETSVWNFYYADDAPEKKEITREFFDQVFKGVYAIYISKIVVDEIIKAPEEKKAELLSLIEKCSPEDVEVNDEVEILAERYIEKGIVPAKKKEDAMHVGVATVAEMDVIVSWNYKHLANVKKEELFYAVNLEQGYKKIIEITTPMGVINDESG